LSPESDSIRWINNNTLGWQRMFIAQFGDSLIAGPVANGLFLRPRGWRELCLSTFNKFFDRLASGENLSPY
jgi:hypothetical protein